MRVTGPSGPGVGMKADRTNGAVSACAALGTAAISVPIDAIIASSAAAANRASAVAVVVLGRLVIGAMDTSFPELPRIHARLTVGGA